MNTYIIRNLPDEYRKSLKVKAAQEKTTMNNLVLEAIRILLEKCNG